MFEKANHIQDLKKWTTRKGSPIFGKIKILRLRPQNPKGPKKKTSATFSDLGNSPSSRKYFRKAAQYGKEKMEWRSCKMC